MDSEVIVFLTAVAGIIGTLVGAEWSARSTRVHMQEQWTRDDAVARRQQGKEAARAILAEVIRAVELFSYRQVRQRIEAITARSGVQPRDIPPHVLGPPPDEVGTHFLEIRRRVVEIADPLMAEWVRWIADVINDNHMILDVGVVQVPEIGIRLEGTSERVLGAYLRDEPLPTLADEADFGELVRARADRLQMLEDMYEQYRTSPPPASSEPEDDIPF